MNTYSLIGSSSAESCFHAGSSDVIHSGSDVISSIFHSCIFVWRRVNMTDDGAGRRTSSYRTGWMAGAQIACSACLRPFTTNCAWTFPTRTTCFGLTQYFTEIITYLATCFFPPCSLWLLGRKQTWGEPFSTQSFSSGAFRADGKLRHVRFGCYPSAVLPENKHVTHEGNGHNVHFETDARF